MEGKAGYGPEVDCWAIGILAYECLVGRTPYSDARTLDEALDLISEFPTMFFNGRAVSREAQNFIAVGLSVQVDESS
jgi:serine/threonine protein kinase